jgi:hypothetical protein
VSRQTKVEELQLQRLFVDKDVLGLDVSMTDLQWEMNRSDRRQKLRKDCIRNLHRQNDGFPSLSPVLAQQRLQGDVSAEEFFHQVEVAWRPDRLLDFH